MKGLMSQIDFDDLSILVMDHPMTEHPMSSLLLRQPWAKLRRQCCKSRSFYCRERCDCPIVASLSLIGHAADVATVLLCLLAQPTIRARLAGEKGPRCGHMAPLAAVWLGKKADHRRRTIKRWLREAAPDLEAIEAWQAVAGIARCCWHITAPCPANSRMPIPRSGRPRPPMIRCVP